MPVAIVKRVAHRRASMATAGFAVLVQLVVLVCIRLFSANTSGGDLCQDAVAVARIQRGQALFQPITTCGVLRDQPHPPASLLAFWPFLQLPLPWAAATWDLVMLAVLGISLALIAHEAGFPSSPWRVAAVALLIVFWPPLLDNLLEAQIMPLLLLLIVLSWRWARQGRSVWAGAALGVAAALRLFPALLVIYFALRRDWRAVGGAVASFVATWLLAVPLIGLDGYRIYLTQVLPSASASWIHSPHNASLWGVAGMLVAGTYESAPLIYRPSLTVPLALVLLAPVLAVLFWRTYARRAATFAADEATFLAYIPAMLLVSPLLWSYYLVLVLMPLLILAGRLGWLGPQRGPAPLSPDSIRRVGWLTGAAIILILATRIMPLLPPALAHSPAILALATYALVVLVVALLTARSVWLPEATGDSASREADRDVPSPTAVALDAGTGQAMLRHTPIQQEP